LLTLIKPILCWELVSQPHTAHTRIPQAYPFSSKEGNPRAFTQKQHWARNGLP